MHSSKLFTKSETSLCLGRWCKHCYLLNNAKYAQTSLEKAQFEWVGWECSGSRAPHDANETLKKKKDMYV